MFRTRPILPTELMCCILNDLEVHDLLNCTLVNKYIRNIIQDSSQLQYCIELAKARMEDTSHLMLDIPSWRTRLKLIRSREDSWRHLRWAKKQTLTLPDSGTVYEFVGGVYANGRENHNKTAASISFLRLPSSTNHLLTSDDSSSLKNVGFEPTEPPWAHSMDDVVVLDFTMDPAQDLLVLVVLAPSTSKFVYEIHLRSLQTNKPHKKAGLPFLSCLKRGASDDPPLEVLSAVRVQVSGNLLAFLVKEAHSDVGAHFSLWNWQENPRNSCSIDKTSGIDDFSLLSQDIFLLVRPPGKLEVYKFRDPADGSNIPLATACYEFPTTAEGYHYWYSSLSSNPSPTAITRKDDMQFQTRAPMTTTIPLPPTTRFARHYSAIEGDEEEEDYTDQPLSPPEPSPPNETPAAVSSPSLHEQQLYQPDADSRIQACCVYILGPTYNGIHQRIHSFVFFVNTSIFLDPPKEWFDATPATNSTYTHPLWNSGGYPYSAQAAPVPGGTGGGGCLPLPPVPFPPQIYPYAQPQSSHRRSGTQHSQTQAPSPAVQSFQILQQQHAVWEQQLVEKQQDRLAMGPPGSGIGGASGPVTVAGSSGGSSSSASAAASSSSNSMASVTSATSRSSVGTSSRLHELSVAAAAAMAQVEMERLGNSHPLAVPSSGGAGIASTSTSATTTRSVTPRSIGFSPIPHLPFPLVPSASSSSASALASAPLPAFNPPTSSHGSTATLGAAQAPSSASGGADSAGQSFIPPSLSSVSWSGNPLPASIHGNGPSSSISSALSSALSSAQQNIMSTTISPSIQPQPQPQHQPQSQPPPDSLAYFYNPPSRRRPPRIQPTWQLKKIPWEVWGPANTRWFVESMTTDWQHAVYGMRAIESVKAGALLMSNGGSGGGNGKGGHDGGGCSGCGAHPGDHGGHGRGMENGTREGGGPRYRGQDENIGAAVNEGPSSLPVNPLTSTPTTNLPSTLDASALSNPAALDQQNQVILIDPTYDNDWDWDESESEAGSTSSHVDTGQGHEHEHGQGSESTASSMSPFAAAPPGESSVNTTSTSAILGSGVGSGSTNNASAAGDGIGNNHTTSGNSGGGGGGVSSSERRNPLNRRHLRLKDFNPYTIFHVKQMEEREKAKKETRNVDVKGKGKEKMQVDDDSAASTIRNGLSTTTGSSSPQTQHKVQWHTPRVVDGPSTCKTKGPFQYDIVSSLPYVEVISEESFEAADVMMDDCRLLLLKASIRFSLSNRWILIPFSFFV
ncbi:hypothetical protein AX16_005952 [Volvariella volvacea WC 439]|nr:hypothetical protein AX16_005952 [Volvariella volvacea WC 439]